MKKTLLLFAFVFLFIGSVFSQTVYITKTGEKYHRERCQHLRKSSISIDIKDAIDAGYEACKVCKPTRSNSSTQKAQNITTQTYYNSENPVTTSVQCSGRTKKGARCKRMTTSSSGRCYQH